MNTPGTILTRLVLYLIILVIGTYVIFFVLEIGAIAVPPVQTYLSCPEGTNIKYTYVKETWNPPGETTLERTCVDSSGKNHDAFSNDVYNQRQNDLFMPMAFVIMLIIEIPLALFHYLRR